MLYFRAAVDTVNLFVTKSFEFMTCFLTLCVSVLLKFQSQDSREEYTSGYVSTNHGDSGGPFWTHDTFDDGQKRSIVIAILSGGIDDGVDISTKKDDFCRAGATKITSEIIKWIKEISGLK